MEIVVRATVIYFFLWMVSRGTGKRQLSQLTAFELVLLVTMGDLVQQGITQEDMSLTGAVLAVGTIAFWAMTFSFLAWRFKGIRPAVEGVPIVIVRDGRPLEHALEMERVTMEELKESARSQGIADLGTVKLAVLEPDGQFSFITGNGQQPGGGTGQGELSGLA